MTENTQETTTMIAGGQNNALVPNALYNHFGAVRIAVDTERLADLTDISGRTFVPDENTQLYEAPGTDEWVRRMVHARTTLLQENLNRRTAYVNLTQHLEALGQAILEEAERRDWCEDYDEFAREWDLPTRTQHYTVNMNVVVEARNEDDALEIVKDNVSLSAWNTDGVIESPDFYAEVR